MCKRSFVAFIQQKSGDKHTFIDVIKISLEIENLMKTMEEIVNREEIKEETYRKILDVETHHEHTIIKDESGIVRWKENPDVRRYLKKISLNDLCPLLDCLGYDKNSEIYRKLYLDMGYSLFGYWEVFYFELNNPEAESYVPTKLDLNKELGEHQYYITLIALLTQSLVEEQIITPMQKTQILRFLQRGGK